MNIIAVAEKGNNMERYVDIDKIFPNGVFFVSEEHPEKSLDELINRICGLPYVDVVPKSEVERLNKELDELAEEHSDLIVEKDQLFDMVEKQKIEIESLKTANEKIYWAFKKQPREIFEEIDKVIKEHSQGYCCDWYLYELIAELKKKYTEETK